jgi:hypothetical protein
LTVRPEPHAPCSRNRAIADGLVLYLRQTITPTITGLFNAEIVLSLVERRRAGDLDNRIKGLLDWPQSRELIADDHNLERLLVYWGEAPHGCRITLTGIEA